MKIQSRLDRDSNLVPFAWQPGQLTTTPPLTWKDEKNLGPYGVAQVNPPSLTPLPWVRPIPPAKPPFWPAWAARQPRKTRNFERVLRALPIICTP